MDAPFARTLHDLLEEQAARRPDAPAVICAGRQLSYGALAARVRRVASALRGRGVRHGDRVGLLLNNRAEFIEACLGAMAAGAVVVPFSTWSTRQELSFLLADSGVQTLFALSSFGKEDFVTSLAAVDAPTLRDRVLVGGEAPPGWLGYETMLAAAPEMARLPPGEAAGAGDDGIVLYTSGSTSKPKAVRMRQHGIVENGFNIGERQGLSADDRVLAAIPLFWAFGAVNALPAALSHGAALVLQSRFEPGEALALIDRHRCTAIYTLPAMTAALLRHQDFAPARTASLQRGLTIGSPQDVLSAANGLGAHAICNIYGASETYGNCCVTPHHWPLAKRSACQGPPLPGNRLRVVDAETGAVLGPDQPGLIEVQGYVMPGYGGASAGETAAVFGADGWFRSGDIGQLDAEGNVSFLGRSGEMIKRSGINVSPAEVEEALLLHPGVSQVGVVGLADPDRGELIIAFVVARPGAAPTAAELAAHCRSVASAYKVPDRIELCAALPTTTTGKLMRRALKDQAALLTRADA